MEKYVVGKRKQELLRAVKKKNIYIEPCLTVDDFKRYYKDKYDDNDYQGSSGHNSDDSFKRYQG